MTSRRQLRTGFFSLELLVSLVLATTVLLAFAYALTQFVRLSDVLMVQQRGALAAEAVLNEIRGGRESTPAELSSRFSNLDFDIRRQPGTGVWEGLTRVTVGVRGTAFGGVPVRVQLGGYIQETPR